MSIKRSLLWSQAELYIPAIYKDQWNYTILNCICCWTVCSFTCIFECVCFCLCQNCLKSQTGWSLNVVDHVASQAYNGLIQTRTTTHTWLLLLRLKCVAIWCFKGTVHSFLLIHVILNLYNFLSSLIDYHICLAVFFCLRQNAVWVNGLQDTAKNHSVESI